MWMIFLASLQYYCRRSTRSNHASPYRSYRSVKSIHFWNSSSYKYVDYNVLTHRSYHKVTWSHGQTLVLLYWRVKVDKATTINTRKLVFVMAELSPISSNNIHIPDSDSVNNVPQVLNLNQIHSHDPKPKHNYNKLCTI